MSTGPTTEAGKAKSSQNARKHGPTGRLMIITGENSQQYLDLINGLMDEHQPLTPTESSLVVRMGQSLWFAQRALTYQSMLFLESPVPDEKQLAIFIRYQTTHDRAFSKALSDLLKLRKETRYQEQEFVSQNQKTELHHAQIRHLTARSEDLETRSHVRKIFAAPLPPAFPAELPADLNRPQAGQAAKSA